MKILIALLISINCFATDYYVASNGSDANPGTQAAPWQSLNKVNSAPLVGDDHVHFRGGDVFYGALNLTRSGTVGHPITFDSYGTGKATITGFTTVSGWQVVNGLSEVSISQVNMVTINGAFQPIGRWPKMSASNKGYLTFQSHGGSSVTSSGLAGSPSFVGGEVVVRNCHWILNRNTVTSQSSSTVNFSGSNYSKTDDGNGFFFQNHVNACTLPNEWSWSGGKLRIFSPSGTVNAATISTLVNLSGRSYLTFTNLVFSGSNTSTVLFQGSHHITFNGCDLLFNGTDAIKADMSTNNISLLNCTIDRTNNNAVNAGTSPSWTIRDTRITNTGAVAGMGGSGDGKYTGIYDVGTGSVIENNVVETTGYVAINFSSVNGNGGGVVVRNNFINGFCLVKDDGAGIYTWGKTGATTLAQRTIQGNIVIDGLGAPEGAGGGNTSAHGIYMDDYVGNVTIEGNSCAGNAGAGIYLHNARNLNINNNTTYNNKNLEIRCMQDDNGAPIRNINMNGNIFFCTTKETASYQFFVMNFRSTTDDISQWGTWNNNFYCRPFTGEAMAITARHPSDFFGTLSQWKTLSGKDGNSKSTPVAVTDPAKIRFEYNESKLARVAILPGSWMDVKGIVYSAHITLAPYTSAVLIQTVSGPATYQSVAKSGSFTRNNCPAGSTGSTVVYSVPVGKYTSTVSQSDADNKAVADVSANGQPYANTNGVCTTTPPVMYSSASKSGTFTRNNCPLGSTGSQVTYTIPAGKYTSSISQADADGQAQGDVNANGQTYANQNGTCSSGTNQPPTVSAGSDKTVSYYTGSCGASVTVTSITTDTDVSFAWSIAPAVPIVNPNNPGITLKGLTKGSYSVMVTVKDSGGLTASDQMTITVTEKYCSFWNRLFGQCRCK